MHARLDDDCYPRRQLFRFDRVRADGEILHPYAGRPENEKWVICFYLPFTEVWGEMPEAEFIGLPVSTTADLRERAHRLSIGAIPTDTDQ